MHEVTVPKLNTNDESYVVTAWLAEDGARVTADSPIVVIETSKASEELVAEHGGVLHHRAEASDECGAGSVIGVIFPTEQDRLDYITAPGREAGGPPHGDAAAAAEDAAANTVITKSAREAAQEYGIELAQLRSLGRAVVKRKDVEELAAARTTVAAAPAPDEILQLSRAQQAVARVVTLSHRTIPAGYVVVKVPVDEALRLAGELTERSSVAIGLPELLVKAVAALRGRFPLMFARMAPDGSARLRDGANVGVTLDIGRGMYIPVLKGAERLTIAQIADTLMDFRISALRGEFTEGDLSGGNITISLHTDEDVVLARAIIHPDHACILCLCGVQDEVRLDEGGEPRVRRHANLGLSYDHRMINGRGATDFLRELKAVLADRDELLKLVA